MSSAQLEIATRAALGAGKIINRESLRLDQIEILKKGKFDYVTQTDIDCENSICETLHQYFPHDTILTEESGTKFSGNSDDVWIVDPLDGTTNFLHGFPQYAVSIALTQRDRVVVGVVYDPVRNELFTAERGKGAFLNNRRIRVSGVRDMAHALIGTGFPFRRNDSATNYLPKFERVAHSVAGLRRAGSNALDLAYVACGRLDGYWEASVHSWDIAAGTLLVLEAGGLVTDLFGQEKYLELGNICSATPKIFADLLMKVTEAKTPATPEN
ncbi:MAG TPA: inositol monophosphatase [Sutterella sp.]|nr:inositol monophosphatase [Sutterella sp.]